MKVTLFCKNPYAYGILKPINDELVKRSHSVIWFAPAKIINKFPYKDGCHITSDIQEIHNYKSDVIYVPGNEVPHYLRGLKVQIFHGLAGEKKGHFRIRKYFDLYLTQGPYFTSRFKRLAKRYKDFDVIETGWPKLDQLFLEKELYNQEKQKLLNEYGVKRIVLYAPTFSPSLTSANLLKQEVSNLANNDNLVLVKFHDLMNKNTVKEYQEICEGLKNAKIVLDNNIIKYLILADVMISDTSSVVYEFLLLNKPVITLNSSSENIRWKDISDSKDLIPAFEQTIEQDDQREDRKWIIDNYHPYTDGMSSKRIVDTVEEYLKTNTIPEKRDIPIGRKLKMLNVFGRVQ